MRQVMVASFLVLQIGCSTSADPDNDSAPLSILILPHSAQIREGELLVCKVAMRNQGVDPIPVKRPPSDENANLIWEIRKQGAHEYSRIRTRWSGSNGCVHYGSDLAILPGQPFVTFDSLFPSKHSQPFVEAGTYEIRVAFDLAGQRIVSQPAEILVTPVVPSEREAVKSAAEFLDAVLGFITPTRDSLTERERDLNASQLKTTYQWLIAFLVGEADADDAARERAAALRNQVPPVMAEALELRVVLHLMNRGKWSAADRLLEQIAIPSYDRDQLKITVKHELQFPSQK